MYVVFLCLSSSFVCCLPLFVVFLCLSSSFVCPLCSHVSSEVKTHSLLQLSSICKYRCRILAATALEQTCKKLVFPKIILLKMANRYIKIVKIFCIDLTEQHIFYNHFSCSAVHFCISALDTIQSNCIIGAEHYKELLKDLDKIIILHPVYICFWKKQE